MNSQSHKQVFVWTSYYLFHLHEDLSDVDDVKKSCRTAPNSWFAYYKVKSKCIFINLVYNIMFNEW